MVPPVHVSTPWSKLGKDWRTGRALKIPVRGNKTIKNMSVTLLANGISGRVLLAVKTESAKHQ